MGTVSLVKKQWPEMIRTERKSLWSINARRGGEAWEKTNLKQKENELVHERRGFSRESDISGKTEMTKATEIKETRRTGRKRQENGTKTITHTLRHDREIYSNGICSAGNAVGEMSDNCRGEEGKRNGSRDMTTGGGRRRVVRTVQ